MKELLDKSNIQETKLKYFISRIVAEHMSKLSEPCYYPPYEKDYHEILHLVGLTEADLKIFIKKTYPSHPAKFYILRDTEVNLLLFLMYYYRLKNDQAMFLYTMMYLGIRFYCNRMKKHFSKFCEPEVFKLALDNLNKTHLFIKEKTISNAIFYLAKEETRKYSKYLDFHDVLKISDFVYEYRHRIAQSMRSFANLYYKISEEGKGYKQPFEGEQGEFQGAQVLERGQRLVGHILEKITVYKQIDHKANENAKKLTNISASTAEDLTKQLSNLKYSQNIKMIIELFIRDLKKTDQLCGMEFYTYTRNLMAIRRTSQEVYFKQQITNLIEMLIKDVGHAKQFHQLTPQTRFQASLFLAYYIAIYIRNTACGL